MELQIQSQRLADLKNGSIGHGQVKQEGLKQILKPTDSGRSPL